MRRTYREKLLDQVGATNAAPTYAEAGEAAH